MKLRPEIERILHSGVFVMGFGLLALSSACSSAEPPLHVAWPETPLQIAFLFESFEDELELVQGPLRTPSEPVLWPERKGAALVLAGLTEEALLTLHPRLELGAELARFALVSGQELCPRGRVLADDRRVFSLPASELSLQVLAGSLEPSDLEAVREALGSYGLEAPLSREGCAARSPTIAAFAPEVELIPPGTVIDGRARYTTEPGDNDHYFGTHGGEWISADAVALTADFNLFWIERDRSFEETLDRRLEYASILPPLTNDGSWVSRALRRAPNKPGILFVGLTGLRAEKFALLEIDTRAGRFEVVSSSVSDGPGIRSIAIDEQGRILVGSGRGVLGHGTVDGGLIGWRAIPNEQTNIDFVVPVEGESSAFLVGTSGGSLYRVEWPNVDQARRLELPGDPTSVSSLSRLDRADSKVFLLSRPTTDPALSTDGLSWPAEPWELPDAARGCAGEADACGARRFSDIVSLSGSLDDEAFIFTPRRCGAMFRYEPDQRCIEAILLPDTSVVAAAPNVTWWGTSRLGDRVIAFGEPARIVEIVP